MSIPKLNLPFLNFFHLPVSEVLCLHHNSEIKMQHMKIYITGILFLLFFYMSAQENQNIELSRLSSGNFPVYKVIEDGGKFRFENTSKPWPLNFKKEGDDVTEVLVNRSGIIEEKYQADLPAFPAYYMNAGLEVVVTAIDKKIYYYIWSIKTGATIRYIFSESKVRSYADEKNTLDTYRNTIKELQTAARNQRINDNNAIAEKLAEENTLKGKTIKTIRIVPVTKPENIGLLTVLAIGIEFELDNGKILKTKNLGGFTPYTDFESEVSGGDFAGGDFKVADDAGKIPNDKIEISVWSKFDEKKIKGKYSCMLNYKTDIHYNYQGSSGPSGRGYTAGYNVNGTNGSDGKSINILVTTLPINGEQIHKLVITDAYSGKVLSEAKVHANNTVNINTSGGSGGNGSEGSGNGGSGGNGGNGGNINLSGNGAAALKISVSSTGGKGGVGGKAKTQSFLNGANGSSGKNGILSK